MSMCPSGGSIDFQREFSNLYFSDIGASLFRPCVVQHMLKRACFYSRRHRLVFKAQPNAKREQNRCDS